jgi:hypothetical protein
LMRKTVERIPLATPTRTPAPMPRRIATTAFVDSAKCAATTPASE